MQDRLKSLPLNAISLLVVSLMAGCVAAPPTRAPARTSPPPPPVAQVPTPTPAPSPVATPPPQRQLPYSPAESAAILAAEAALNVGDLAQAKARLDAILDQSLRPGEMPHLQLLNARIAAAEGRPNAVLERLPIAMIDADLAAAAEALRADALRELGDFIGAIASWAERDRWLSDPGDRKANENKLWATVLEAPLAPSDLERGRAMGGVVKGWVALGLLARQPNASALEQWAADYPNHPAEAQFQALFSRPAGGGFAQAPLLPGARWAVLLPLTGPLASVGEVIRDGWVTAYLKAGAMVPVQFFDTAGTTDGALRAFDEALASGAVMVIGPLRRESVMAIAQRGHLPVPVIALNQLPPDMGWVPNLYQFALAPEDEARAAADHAVSQGLRTAVSLLPDNDWGQRVETAFRERIEALGGRLLSSRRYAPRTDDFSDSIKALMQIGESEARHRQVSGMLGERPVFQTRRRADVDFVFFAGRPTDGRLIWSQFRFHRAQDLPAYATAMIYEPGMRPGTDLAGSRFCDMPWMLDAGTPEGRELASLVRQMPSGGGQPRLFAMGLDAFALAANVARGQAGLGYSVLGSTGELWFDVNGGVQRRLDCARFTQTGFSKLPRPADFSGVVVEDPFLDALRREEDVSDGTW